MVNRQKTSGTTALLNSVLLNLDSTLESPGERLKLPIARAVPQGVYSKIWWLITGSDYV